MAKNSLNKDQIINLLPHREPMLLIDELVNIVPLKSAVGIVNVKTIETLVVWVPASILPPSEYSADPVKSRLGFLVVFSFKRIISLFLISFLINWRFKLLTIALSIIENKLASFYFFSLDQILCRDS